MQLTLQAFNDGHWHDAYHISLDKPEAGRLGRVTLQPLFDYAALYFDEAGARSFSALYPVNPMDIHAFKSWPAIFEDIMPMGYARKLWLDLLNLQQASSAQQDLELLKSGTIAPVGNLRLKESITALSEQLADLRFEQAAVVERDHDFLTYARQRGAVSGGATGAGGAAPKLLVRLNQRREVWIDPLQSDNEPDLHYLVKFPRGNAAIDRDILRTEFHFYHELASMGFNTMQIDQLQLHEGSKNPSLWLPRFDRAFHNGKIERYGLESVFSLMNKSAGSYLKHEDVLAALVNVITDKTIAALTTEYLQRDLLNVVFGNSDNHGRNTAVLKQANIVSLAPIYDFAPMKADPEIVVRTTNWSNQIEKAGDIAWLELCERLECYGDPDGFKQALRQLADQLVDLPARLAARGVPDSILKMPVMEFTHLEQRLNKWGLLK
ncbi:MAG: hypothetical protein B7X50_12240 [Alishewanella sp. 34-51-39]|nr:MAG: hypothetical protein B7X50_12240 [Alishewanella sp. 34-51-39]